mgnify:CR=1 FL=1
MSLKFTGSYSELQTKLNNLNGTWDESQTNKKVLRVGSGLLNWYESTGTIQFQGQGAEKEKLESEVPHLIYPQQFPKPEIVAKAENIPIENTQKSINIKEQTIERKYLKSIINDSELIIGIVSAVGTESKRVIDPLKDRLTGFGYDVEEVRVSGILTSYANTGTSREYDRIKHYMESGDSLRKDSQSNAILAAGVAKQILNNRTDSSTKKAYIINSLKHPSEVDLLRKVYGDGFYLIGIHADEKRRHKYLTDDKGCTLEQANELIKIDEDESFGHGQKTRDTYHLADFFLNLGKNDDHVKNRLQRFLELIFSHPYKNPTFDEFAMFMAFNSSVRSGDLSRQVGAVISQNNQIIATGANDVPQSGGGLYWAEADPETGEVSDHQDGKDYTRDGDSNKQAQAEIALEIAKKLLDSGIVDSDKEPGLNEILTGSKISDLTEFGRVVHAEMDALLSCGRAGIPTVGTTLYCTTFPCHNCAKHIIAGGIKRVVYVEPYPKSRALDFHSESIQLKSEFDKSTQDNQLIDFEAFIGVGPRRFLDLFSMNLGAGSKLKRKDKEGSTIEWDKSSAPIRTPLIPKSYIEIEQAAAEIWEEQAAKDRPL